MTNIIEIIAQLNKENFNIDVVISDGHIYVVHRQQFCDITKMSFSDQIRLVAYLLNKEIFN